MARSKTHCRLLSTSATKRCRNPSLPVSNFPDKTKTAVPIACTASHSAQNIAFNELGRQAITADHNWSKGEYSSNNTIPDKGLAVARMAAHITYLSKKGLQEKFGRKLQERDDLKFGFDADFQIESYLRYQGSVFVDRFPLWKHIGCPS